MIDPVECRSQIRVQGPYPLGVRALARGMDYPDRVLAAAPGPEPV